MESSKLSVILNVIATILSWTAYGLGIASVTSHGWIYYTNDNINAGLWRNCTNDNCVIIETVEPYLNATRAFIILMVIFNFLGNLVNIVSQWKPSEKSRSGSGNVWLISAIFGTVGAAVYSGVTPQVVPSSDFVFGYGFILAWVSVGLLYISNPCNYYSAKKMSDC